MIKDLAIIGHASTGITVMHEIQHIQSERGIQIVDNSLPITNTYDREILEIRSFNDYKDGRANRRERRKQERKSKTK